MRSRRRRFRLETSLAAASGLLGVLTLLWPDWIELVTKLDPDHGDGTAEWLIVAGLLLVAAILAVAARYELRHIRRSAAASTVVD